MSIYLDSGTTAMEVALAIKAGLTGVNELSISTHGINIAIELSGHPAFNVHLIGGELYHNGLSTVGPVALGQIAQSHFDLFFMGARGIDEIAGWTNANQLETQLKHATIAGSAKWGHRGLSVIVPLNRVPLWVTDADLPNTARKAAKAAGVGLLIAT
jgi:DeoR/GlpR family transcriptional regulator of sugar metabolism